MLFLTVYGVFGLELHKFSCLHCIDCITMDFTIDEQELIMSLHKPINFDRVPAFKKPFQEFVF